MRAAIVVSMFATVAAAAAPEPPALRVLFAKGGQVTMTPKVKVGEPFTMTITVTPRAGVGVSMPASFAIAPFEVVAKREVPAGAGERSFELAIVAWEAGDLKLPPIAIPTFAGGETGEVKTAEFAVTVEPTIVDENAEPRPIAGPVAVRVRDLTLVWIAAGALGGIALALAAASAWRRARRRRAAERAALAAADTRTPEEIALAHLAALAEEGMGADPRPFYFRLTEIVRDYLGRRLGFDAMELTTEELLGRLGDHVIRADLAQWLRACDLVKYARASASVDEARLELEQAVTIVNRCRPAPPEVRVAA